MKNLKEALTRVAEAGSPRLIKYYFFLGSDIVIGCRYEFRKAFAELKETAKSFLLVKKGLSTIPKEFSTYNSQGGDLNIMTGIKDSLLKTEQDIMFSGIDTEDFDNTELRLKLVKAGFIDTTDN